MNGFLSDVRHGLRLYRRSPGSSLIAVTVLAVGMACVSAFVSLYVDLVLRPHPGFVQSSRIVTLAQTDGARTLGLPAGLIDRIAEGTASLDAVAGASPRYRRIGRETDGRFTESVTRSFFSGIRPRIALGRGLAPADHEPDAEPAVVISYRYWQDRFDGSPDVLGTMLEIADQRLPLVNGQPVFENGRMVTEEVVIAFRIVGVMARGMNGMTTDQTVAWLPGKRADSLFFGTDEATRSASMMRAFGRRTAGASAEAVVRELNARYLDARDALTLQTDTPQADTPQADTLQTGFRLDAVDGIVRDLNVKRDAERQLELFLLGSLLLALVAACNVSLFLLARAPGRRRELGIRMAVGAPIRRLARQLVSEAGLLVAASAVLGLVLSVWLSAYLRGLAFLRDAEWREVTLLDWRVLGLVGLFLVIVTLLVSLAPILGLERLGIATTSRHVIARANLAQRIAGTAQIAVAGALGGAAVAFGWYLGSLMLSDPGYETRDLYRLRFSQMDGPISTEIIAVEIARRRAAIEALPGVTAVAFGEPVPSADTQPSISVAHPTEPTERVRVRQGIVDSRFVDLLGLRLLHGSSPAENHAAVVLVNRTLALQFWGRENVVGEILPFDVPGLEVPRVIGVLADVSFGHPSADIEPAYFTTVANIGFLTVPEALIESTLPAGALQQQLQGLVDAGRLEVGVEGSIEPLRMLRTELIAADRARSLLTIAAASLVVCIAVFGFYGMQRYLVASGRREYAVRASLGAGPRALGRLVLGRGLLLGTPGLVLGTMLAFIASAWLRDEFVLREISAAVVAAVVAAALTTLLLAASLGPAGEARRTQPAPLLREQ